MRSTTAILLSVVTTIAGGASAQSEGNDMAAIAQKLNNPVASMISLPFQNNFDWGGGLEDEGFQYKLNFQPVIPFKLNEHWNLISRTIVPYIYQEDRIGDTTQSGFGDTTASFFFSPQGAPGAPIWGIGPIVSIPTGTDDLSSEQWGAGPTVLVLMQDHGWTYGILASHLWSLHGDEDREDLNLTFLQPFLSYTTPKHTTFGVNLEASYDWTAEEWTVPVNVFITQLVKIGDLPVNFQLGGRYYAEKPDGGPDWGLRFSVTFVIPQS